MNVLLIIPIVIGIISLWSLFLTATSDPGVHLRSSDPGARPRPRAPPPRPACPRDARRRAAIVDEADRRDQATGWRFTCGSMDGELRDLKYCRAAPAPPRPCRAPPAGSSRAAVAADQARARSSARRARRTATSATTASRASTTTAPGERPAAAAPAPVAACALPAPLTSRGCVPAAQGWHLHRRAQLPPVLHLRVLHGARHAVLRRRVDLAGAPPARGEGETEKLGIFRFGPKFQKYENVGADCTRRGLLERAAAEALGRVRAPLSPAPRHPAPPRLR